MASEKTGAGAMEVKTGMKGVPRIMLHDAAIAAPRVLVVVLNYRTPELAIACLRSIPRATAGLRGVEVVIADNDSRDGSVERIGRSIDVDGLGRFARLMPLPVNGGFAYGNNAAIREALGRSTPPDYVVLLNPDTEPRASAIRELVSFMDAHPGVGIAGSRLEDPDGTPQCSAFNFPNTWSELDRGLRLGVVSRLLARRLVHQPIPDHACRVDWVAGASLIVRRSVFERIGLLDEGYFLYFEEVDFLLAAHRAGFPTWYVPSSRVVHHVGRSTGVTDREATNRRVPAYWFESRKRYFLKNHGPARALLADAAWMVGFALHRLRRVAQLRHHSDPPHVFADFVKNGLSARAWVETMRGSAGAAAVGPMGMG